MVEQGGQGSNCFAGRSAGLVSNMFVDAHGAVPGWMIPCCSLMLNFCLKPSAHTLFLQAAR